MPVVDDASVPVGGHASVQSIQSYVDPVHE